MDSSPPPSPDQGVLALARIIHERSGGRRRRGGFGGWRDCSTAICCRLDRLYGVQALGLIGVGGVRALAPSFR